MTNPLDACSSIRLPCAVCDRRNRQVAGQAEVPLETGAECGAERARTSCLTRWYTNRGEKAQMTTQRVADSVCRLREHTA